MTSWSRHQRGELAVGARDAGLPDGGRTAAMQWRAFGVRSLPTGYPAKKLVLLSIVVVICPACRFATAAVPPRLSAKRHHAPPCSTPLRLLAVGDDPSPP